MTTYDKKKLLALLTLIFVRLPSAQVGGAHGSFAQVAPPEDVSGKVFIFPSSGGAPISVPTIQAGVDAASDGDTILLSNGLHMGMGNRDIIVAGKKLVIKSEHGPSGCIMDCRRESRAFVFEGSGVGRSTVLSGITIRNAFSRSSGGGIYCSNGSTPIVEECVFLRCETGVDGGAVSYSHLGPNMGGAVRNCVFSDNFALGDGGALVGDRVLIEYCTFVGNRSVGPSGGGALRTGSAALVRNSLFVANTSLRSGGAIASQYSSIEGSTFVSNVAATGGAIGISPDPLVTVSNCIFWHNQALSGNGATMAYGSFSGLGLVTVNHCLVEGGASSLGGASVPFLPPPQYKLINVLDTDPLFASTSLGDFRLSDSSPCIDAGDPSFVPRTNEGDIDFQPRIAHDRIDIGADELCKELAHSLVWPGRPATTGRITVTGASPGSLVHFFVGSSLGNLAISIDACLELQIRILDPQLLSVAVANAEGAAQHVGFVPAQLSGQTLYFQAIGFDRSIQQCSTSNIAAFAVSSEFAGSVQSRLVPTQGPFDVFEEPEESPAPGKR